MECKLITKLFYSYSYFSCSSENKNINIKDKMFNWEDKFIIINKNKLDFSEKTGMIHS